MKLFARGQRSRLDAITPSLEFLVGLKIEAPGLAIDFCCFGLDADGKLSDDRFFVFYNQTSSPAQAIEKASSAGDDEGFRVRLENLPPTVRRLVFTASVDGAGTMAQIGSGHLRLRESSGAEVMRYEFSGRDFTNEGALMLGEIYWKDGWRAWAVGQGFMGDLGALLKYFGGEEVEEAAPSPTPPAIQSPQAVPQLPSSPPAPLVSASVAPTPPVVAMGAAAGALLQKLIDDAPPGGTVEIGRGEFAGPVVIRRPLILQGAGGVIWAQAGPVVTITSANVSLRDVEIEVTALESAEGASGQGDVALLAQPSTCPALHNLRVRGRVIGAGEDSSGRWKLPASLDLGTMAPRAENSFELQLEVPVACSLWCSIAGVALEPPQLGPGEHRVRLTSREVPPESFVCGRIEVRAGDIVRSVPLSGRSGAEGAPLARNRILAG